MATSSFATTRLPVGGEPRPSERTGRRLVLLISNPLASGTCARAERTAADILGARHELHVVRSEHPGHATALAAGAAAEGWDAVAVLGGDGTVREAAAGLVGSGTALACLPGGCTNVYGRTLGVPRRIAAAGAWTVEALAAGDRRRVDVGLLDGRPFLFAVGIGLSAALMRAAEERRSAGKRVALRHFLAGAAGELARSRSAAPVRVSAGTRALEGSVAVVQNSDPLTFVGPRPLRVCAGAGPQTGTLSAAVASRASLRELPAAVPRLLSKTPGAVLAHRRVDGLTAVDEVRIEGLGGPVAVELDGTWVGDMTAATCTVLPGALLVVA